MAKQDVIRNIAKGAAYALLGYGVYTLIKKGSVKETAEAIAEVPEKLAAKAETIVETTAEASKDGVEKLSFGKKMAKVRADNKANGTGGMTKKEYKANHKKVKVDF